jgi:hypothetical protein
MKEPVILKYEMKKDRRLQEKLSEESRHLAERKVRIAVQ